MFQVDLLAPFLAFCSPPFLEGKRKKSKKKSEREREREREREERERSVTAPAE